MLKHSDRIKEQCYKNGSNLHNSAKPSAVFLPVIYTAKSNICQKGLGRTMWILIFLFFAFYLPEKRKAHMLKNHLDTETYSQYKSNFIKWIQLT